MTKPLSKNQLLKLRVSDFRAGTDTRLGRARGSLYRTTRQAKIIADAMSDMLRIGFVEIPEPLRSMISPFVDCARAADKAREDYFSAMEDARQTDKEIAKYLRALDEERKALSK